MLGGAINNHLERVELLLLRGNCVMKIVQTRDPKRENNAEGKGIGRMERYDTSIHKGSATSRSPMRWCG